jgi:hypothetical protein
MEVNVFIRFGIIAILIGLFAAHGAAALPLGPRSVDNSAAQPCSPFTVLKPSGSATAALFQSTATFAGATSTQAVGFPTIRVCCYKYLGCFICVG